VRRAAAHDALADASRRQEVRLELDGREREAIGDVVAAAMAAHVSASATIAGAKRKPVPAMRFSVTSMCPTIKSFAE